MVSSNRPPLSHEMSMETYPSSSKITKSYFLSDEANNAANTVCICECFCEVWWKIRRQAWRKAHYFLLSQMHFNLPPPVIFLVGLCTPTIQVYTIHKSKCCKCSRPAYCNCQVANKSHEPINLCYHFADICGTIFFIKVIEAMLDTVLFEFCP